MHFRFFFKNNAYENLPTYLTKAGIKVFWYKRERRRKRMLRLQAILKTMN